MSKFKAGDKVLVEAYYDRKESGIDPVVTTLSGYSERHPASSGRAVFANGERSIHPMPPVSYEALMEELELWTRDPLAPHEFDRLEELKSQRLAAMNPGPKEGDEVWLRVEIAHAPTKLAGGTTVRYRRRKPQVSTDSFGVYPDDIKIIKGE